MMQTLMGPTILLRKFNLRSRSNISDTILFEGEGAQQDDFLTPSLPRFDFTIIMGWSSWKTSCCGQYKIEAIDPHPHLS